MSTVENEKEIIEFKIEDLKADETKVIKIDADCDILLKDVLFNANVIKEMHITKRNNFVITDAIIVKLYSENAFICLLYFSNSVVIEKTKNQYYLHEKRA